MFVLLHRDGIDTSVLDVYKTEDKAWEGAGAFIEERADMEHLRECYPDEKKWPLSRVAQHWGEYTLDDEDIFVEEHEVK